MSVSLTLMEALSMTANDNRGAARNALASQYENPAPGDGNNIRWRGHEAGLDRNHGP